MLYYVLDLMSHTRLSSTSRYQSDLREEDWTTVKNILKYLLRTKDLFLVYSGRPDLTITCYSDTSFQTDKDNLKSQIGYMFIINDGAVIRINFQKRYDG